MVDTINVDIINEETLDAGVTVEDVLHKDGNIIASGNIGGNNLSGTNTGDETESSIKTKLGIATLSGSNTGDQDLSGYVLTSRTINSQSLTGNITLTTADIADSTDKRYCTDAQKTVIGNTSGINTGDETQSSIKTKLGITTLSGSNTGDQDLSGLQAAITGGATTITANNLTANKALVSDSSGKVAVSAVTNTELGYLSGVTSNIQSQINNIISGPPNAFKYGKYTLSTNQTTNLAVNNHIQWNTSAGSLGGLSTGTGQQLGIITLPANKTYKIRASVDFNFNASGRVQAVIYDRTNDAWVGLKLFCASTTFTGNTSSQSTLEGEITVGVTPIDIEIRFIMVTAFIQVNYEFSQLYIEEYAGY